MTYRHCKIVALTANGSLAHEAHCDDLETAYAIAEVYVSRRYSVKIRSSETGEMIEEFTQ